MFGSDLSRRAFLGTAAAASVSLATHKVMAQDPEAIASPGATPEANLPVVPPEFETETNWPVENYDIVATRNVMGSNISAETVTTMGDAWKYKLEISAPFGALVSPPAIVDGVVYQQDAMSNVYAMDLESGEILWTIEHNEDVPSGGPNGVAVAYGNVYYTVGGPADVIAVKAEDGSEIWRNNVQGIKSEGITIAPSVYDNRVYVSTIPGTADSFYSGGERGMIISLDASTGEVIWYFDTTTDNLWGNAVVNSGGGLWHPPSFDEEGMVYAGTGNAAPYPGNEEYPSGTSRLGDNDYANSTLKIDPETGSLVWYNNIKPFDLFDLDNQLTPILVESDGRKLAVSSGKHGYVVALDRETGEEVWRTAVGQHENDDVTEIPEGETISVLPGTLGGVETPMAISNGKVFAPVYNMASVYSGSELDPESIDFLGATGQLVCLDLASGEILWDVEEPKGSLAAATVVNDVVFTGCLDGVVRAYNVEDGSLLWTYQATAGLNAPFAVSGDYLIVPAAGPWAASEDSWETLPDGGGAHLIALKLNGTPQDEAAAGTPAAGEDQATPMTGGDMETVEVEAVDIDFNPNELSIAADTDVTIHFKNSGFLEHDFVIEGTDYATAKHPGGGEEDLVVNLPAGEYVYFCSVPGHREQGMVGTLTVA